MLKNKGYERKVIVIVVMVLSSIFLSSSYVGNEENVCVENINEDICVASVSTIFDGKDDGKTTNIKLSADAINGMVLQNGEEFSFNEVVGRRTEERGYKEADVIVTGSDGISRKVRGLGGGICQVSSTLHMTIKEAQMQVIERREHSMPVDYCLREDEAMINYGTSDFRWINTSGNTLKIEIYTLNNEEGFPYKVTCKLWQQF